ncbi:hypothetical protein ACQEVB_22450 [Pseudonocardia sp. CA-107938]|uniref:hypothetical protein n=1 Tax=Pseudonocardia sp. CA-107938 TaxID=3240021 RepID=UPI003D9503AF
MIGRWPLRGWPDGFPGRVPIVSDVTAALGIDPLVVLLRSTAAIAVATLRGRESTVTAGAVRVRGVLEELTVGQDPRGVLGRLGEVRMVARDVVWSATRLRRVTLSGRNVHVRPAAISATVVAAPVLIDVDVAPEDLPPIHPRLRLVIDADGRATLHPTATARIGLEVAPEHAETGLTVVARALQLGSRRVRLPAWGMLRRQIPTDALPAGVRLVGVETADGVVRVSAELERWTAPITAATLTDLAARLTAGATEVALPVGE